MEELSQNINSKVSKLKESHRKALDELEESRKQEIAAITLRLEKALRDKEFSEDELKRYIGMYESLNKYFKSPHDGALFEERSENSIYEVLSKCKESSINIFWLYFQAFNHLLINIYNHNIMIHKSFRWFSTLNAQYLANGTKNAVRF